METQNGTRELSSSHLGAVVIVHSRAFPDSALTKLGSGAVYRYYHWQLEGPHDHHCLGLFQESRLAGFAVGGTSRAALAGFVNRNRFFLVGRVLLTPGLVFSNRGLKAMTSGLRALGRLRMRRRGNTSAAEGETPPSFGVLAIAVDPACQGQGVGWKLMERLEQIAREKRYPRMHLTVNPANAQAIRFYEKLGWKKCVHNGKWGGAMEKEL